MIRNIAPRFNNVHKPLGLNERFATEGNISRPTTSAISCIITSAKASLCITEPLKPPVHHGTMYEAPNRTYTMPRGDNGRMPVEEFAVLGTPVPPPNTRMMNVGAFNFMPARYTRQLPLVTYYRCSRCQKKPREHFVPRGWGALNIVPLTHTGCNQITSLGRDIPVMSHAPVLHLWLECRVLNMQQ